MLWWPKHRDMGRQLIQFYVDPKTGEQCPADQRNAVERRAEVFVTHLTLTPHIVSRGQPVGYDKQGSELYADVVRPATKLARPIERWVEVDCKVAELSGDAAKHRIAEDQRVLGEMMLEALMQVRTFADRLEGERAALRARRAP